MAGTCNFAAVRGLSHAASVMCRMVVHNNLRADSRESGRLPTEIRAVRGML